MLASFTIALESRGLSFSPMCIPIKLYLTLNFTVHVSNIFEMKQSKLIKEKEKRQKYFRKLLLHVK